MLRRSTVRLVARPRNRLHLERSMEIQHGLRHIADFLPPPALTRTRYVRFRVFFQIGNMLSFGATSNLLELTKDCL